MVCSKEERRASKLWSPDAPGGGPFEAEGAWPSGGIGAPFGCGGIGWLLELGMDEV